MLIGLSRVLESPVLLRTTWGLLRGDIPSVKMSSVWLDDRLVGVLEPTVLLRSRGSREFNGDFLVLILLLLLLFPPLVFRLLLLLLLVVLLKLPERIRSAVASSFWPFSSKLQARARDRFSVDYMERH